MAAANGDSAVVLGAVLDPVLGVVLAVVLDGEMVATTGWVATGDVE
jgi:hypothetical protein